MQLQTCSGGAAVASGGHGACFLASCLRAAMRQHLRETRTADGGGTSTHGGDGVDLRRD